LSAQPLTLDTPRRGGKAIAAALAKRDAAAPAAAYELLAIAELASLSDLQRAQVVRLRAQMEFVRSRGGDTGAPQIGETAPQLLNAAGQLESLDDYSARESYLEALAAAMYAGRLGDADAVARVAECARTAADRLPESPRPVDFLLKGMAERFAGGVNAGSGPLRVALERMCEQARKNELQIRRWMVPGFPILQESAAHELWDDSIVLQLSTAAVRHARDAGALAVLPQALIYRAGVHLLAGEFTTAATLIDEANSIAAATDHYAPVRYHWLLLTAWRGNAADAIPLIEAATADGTARGEGRVLGLTGYASAVLYNGLCRYEEAVAAAREACEYEDPGFYNWCLFELIEAATRAGDRKTATWALRRLEERASASGTDWGLGALSNAQALLADDELADSLYTEAIERLERTRIVVHLARTHLH